MPQAQVFISYRRDDAAGYARAVGDALVRELGTGRVFMDVDDIGAGQPFSDVIRRAVGSAEVMLVLIGKRWLGKRAGQPARIHDPDDFVRLEVATALERGMRVIPLLLDGAVMPAAAQLPEALQALAGRHALALDNTRFAADLERLLQALNSDAGAPPDKPAPSLPRPIRARRRAALGAVVVAVLGVTLWQARAPSTEVPAAGGGAARPDINGQWQAEVVYDWPNARYLERFSFGGEARELHGSASFLRVPRGVLEGVVEPGGLRFMTRTDEINGPASVHRYRARLVGSELRIVMQTEGGSSAHRPVEFVARRVAPAASAARP